MIGYDKRKQLLIVEVEGKEVQIGASPFEVVNYKINDKVLLQKEGKHYSLVK